MIKTERIILRKASFADCDKFAIWESQKNVIENFCTDGKRDLDRITNEFHRLTHDPTAMWLTIVMRATGEPIGRVGLTGIDPINDCVNLTNIYIGDENLRGQGLGEEATRATLEYVFTELDMHRLISRHFLDDVRSEHLYSKLGFRTEGTLKKAGKQGKEYLDMRLRAILRDEWEEHLEVEAAEAAEQ